jgi:hypothetical protein
MAWYCYIFGTMLFIVSATEKGMVNWAKWFKVKLHKDMIVVQRKAGKIGNNLLGLAFTLVVKHYSALEYTKEDEE